MRYCDDIILFSKSREEVNGLLEILGGLLGMLGLRLNDNKITRYIPGDELEFLGLKYVNGKIDIAGKTPKTVKREVSKICKRYRRLVETKKLTTDYALDCAVKKLNNYFHKWGNRDDRDTLCSYIYSNIETVDTLRELDFYVKDRLRYIITGKNNSKNYSYLRDGVKGWHSLCEMFYLYKQDVDVYRNEVWLL
jgi:hypothetical protein